MKGTQPWVLSLQESGDRALCGGKAAHLARLIEAGLPVPPGFVVTTAAYIAAGDAPHRSVPEPLRTRITQAYLELGSPAVAVRSSATAEDLDDASLAGQYTTILGIEGPDAVLEAVATCWESLRSHRSAAYLAKQTVDVSQATMAVVVQTLVPAETAGVLFTVGPQEGAQHAMLMEGSWGLGEAIVSGQVQPDRVRVDRDTGAVLEYTVSTKEMYIPPGSRELKPVPRERRDAPCLSEEQITMIWNLGLRAVEVFGGEQDIEWAVHESTVYLLQSRAITTSDRIDSRGSVLSEMRDRLRRHQSEGRGGWVQHNVAETLPHPTPLTWSILRRFFSGSGGFGELYRQAGFLPSAKVCAAGFLELIGGRVYMDLSLAPEMYFAGFPFRHDPALLKLDPAAAQRPPTAPVGGLVDRIRAMRRLACIDRGLDAKARSLDAAYLEREKAALAEWMGPQKKRALTVLSGKEWCALWKERERRVLDELGPSVLFPSLIATKTVEDLRQFLAANVWHRDPDELAQGLAVPDEMDSTIRANAELGEVATGTRSLEEWLRRHGHRGPQEFDLAAPRWRERPEEVLKLAERVGGGPMPAELHAGRVEVSREIADSIAKDLSAAAARKFQAHLSAVKRSLPFREDGKDLLMLGYDLLRDLALEAGRRLEIGEEVFLLERDELFSCMQGAVLPHDRMRDRRRVREVERTLPLPLVITAQDIETLGKPTVPPGGSRLAATPVSFGACRGRSRIVRSPDAAEDLESGDILVCSSTDPSWTPLFTQATGLILERGGILSHGAIVAREMGLPAVVLPDATRVLLEGETVAIDSVHGAVIREEVASGVESSGDDSAKPGDTRISWDRAPPPPSEKARLAGSLRTVSLLFWGVFLAASFLLPAPWIRDPSMAVLDSVLWPAVRHVGHAGTVALLAALFATIVLIAQRFLTDNAQLREIKKRARLLRKEAAQLPRDAPRRTVLQRAAAAGDAHLVGASLVPIAVFLGPLVMTFLWLPVRVDPTAWNPFPGSTAYVTAVVDAEQAGAISLFASGDIHLDPATPPRQAPPPVRATLEDLLEELRAGEWGTPAMAADLERYLAGPMPPAQLSWTLHPPPERSGRFPVRLSAEEHPPLEVNLILGDRSPPERREDLGDGKGPVHVARPADADSPIHLVRITYNDRRPRESRAFLQPLKNLRWDFLERSGWSQWDAGWLWTYIAVYLAAILVLRPLLRLP